MFDQVVSFDLSSLLVFASSALEFVAEFLRIKIGFCSICFVLTCVVSAVIILTAPIWLGIEGLYKLAKFFRDLGYGKGSFWKTLGLYVQIVVFGTLFIACIYGTGWAILAIFIEMMK